jgi:hypothetical protein
MADEIGKDLEGYSRGPLEVLRKTTRNDWIIVRADIRNEHVLITSRKYYRCANFSVTISVRLLLLCDQSYKLCVGGGGGLS